MSAIDTAHNTVLSILVEMGLVGLALASVVLVFAIRAALNSRAVTRSALITALAVWLVSSLVGTTAESRTTWLLFALMAVAEKITAENREREPHQAQTMSSMCLRRIGSSSAEAAH